MARWYYFIRSGDRFLPRKERPVSLPRPDDAHPANGDPLTPWYQKEDHCDADHIHVFAASKTDATEKAASMLRCDQKNASNLSVPPFDQNQ